MQIQSKYNTRVKLLLPVDRGFLVKTRSEAQSTVSRPYESRFSPYKFSIFLVFQASISFFWSKIFVFSLSLVITCAREWKSRSRHHSKCAVYNIRETAACKTPSLSLPHSFLLTQRGEKEHIVIKFLLLTVPQNRNLTNSLV